jgi:hypothetical protein
MQRKSCTQNSALRILACIVDIHTGLDILTTEQCVESKVRFSPERANLQFTDRSQVIRCLEHQIMQRHSALTSALALLANSRQATM